MDTEYYGWQEFEKDVEIIVRLIKDRGLEFKNVYGLPRGGLVLAVCLSHRLNIPLILDAGQIGITTLIVDDIADTGKTLFPYRGNFVATLFFHRQCERLFVPDIYLRLKEDKWVRFPWEEQE